MANKYMTKEEIEEMSKFLLEDGWQKMSYRTGYIKGDISLDFKYATSYGYHRPGSPVKPTQIRMSFRNRKYHDVAKWTSYPKFSKEWVATTYAHLSVLLDEDQKQRDSAEIRRRFMAQVSDRAEALNKELGLPWGTISAYEYSPDGEPFFNLKLTKLSEEQIVALAKLALRDLEGGKS